MTLIEKNIKNTINNIKFLCQHQFKNIMSFDRKIKKMILLNDDLLINYIQY